MTHTELALQPEKHGGESEEKKKCVFIKTERKQADNFTNLR